jgi:hypothetical protein
MKLHPVTRFKGNNRPTRMHACASHPAETCSQLTEARSDTSIVICLLDSFDLCADNYKWPTKLQIRFALINIIGATCKLYVGGQSSKTWRIPRRLRPLYILMDPDSNWKAWHQHIRLATNMKCAGVNIYGHPNISCEDPHRFTTKKFFYLELKRNQQFYRLSAEQIHEITIRLPAPPMTNENNYEKFCIHIICQLHHSHYHFNTTSHKIYMTNKTWLSNIPLIDSNTHWYAMVVLSLISRSRRSGHYLLSIQDPVLVLQATRILNERG